jgi:hypothetical protein
MWLLWVVSCDSIPTQIPYHSAIAIYLQWFLPHVFELQILDVAIFEMKRMPGERPLLNACAINECKFAFDDCGFVKRSCRRSRIRSPLRRFRGSDTDRNSYPRASNVIRWRNLHAVLLRIRYDDSPHTRIDHGVGCAVVRSFVLSSDHGYAYVGASRGDLRDRKGWGDRGHRKDRRSKGIEGRFYRFGSILTI